MPGMHGWVHVNRAIQECDVLLNIGGRFDDRVTGKASTFAPNAKVIHVDIDPSEIGKNVKVDGADRRRRAQRAAGAAGGAARARALAACTATPATGWSTSARCRRKHQRKQQYLDRARHVGSCMPHDVYAALNRDRQRSAATTASSPTWASTRCGPRS